MDAGSDKICLSDMITTPEELFVMSMGYDFFLAVICFIAKSAVNVMLVESRVPFPRGTLKIW